MIAIILTRELKEEHQDFLRLLILHMAPIGIKLSGKGLDLYGTLIGIRGVLVSNQPYSYVFQGGIIPAGMINEKNPASQERSVAEMYGVDPERTIQYQVGPYISAAYNKEICKNVSYSGRLDLFSDFAHSHPKI